MANTPVPDLDALFRTAPVGFAFLDRDLRYVSVNDRLAEINGRPPAEHLGLTGAEIVPDIARRIEPILRQVLETGQPVDDVRLSACLPSAPSEVRHWRVSPYPVHDGTGAVIGVGIVVIDTTAQARAESALRESEARFRTLADNISQFAWMADATGWIFWYNRRWFEYTGTTLEEMQGWGWTKVHHPDHVDRVVARIQRAWATGEPWEDTFPLRGRDGQYRWFLSRALPIRDADGGIVRWFGTNTDITELRQAEEAQRLVVEASRVFAEAAVEPETSVQTICRHVADVVGDGACTFLVGPDGDRLQLAAVYHPDAALLARTRAVLSAARDPVDERLISRVFRSGEPVLIANSADVWAIAPGIASRQLDELGITSLLLVPLRARGRSIGALGVWRQGGGAAYTAHDQQMLQDLADRAGLAIDNSRLLAQTQAALRLRDEVLGAVSHDLKAPLSAIKGTAQLLERRAAREGMSSERLREAAQRIDRAASRMTVWIEELLDVAQLEAGRALTLRLGQVDLVELTAQAVADHQQTTADHAIVFETRLERLPGWFDAARLRRVVDNLLSNAVKFSPGGEPIAVRLDRGHDATGAWAVLEVEDRGVGIPAADVPHIFERFHRAQNVVGHVGGTGIGLAGARQIVEQHGGRIELRSQEGRGSTFTVRLPLPPGSGQADRAA